MTTRTGIGFDVHPLVESRPLVLGGVTVPFDRGLSGHSDGDVLIHAVIDALLGGAGLGDIGMHFPPRDETLRDIESGELLRRTCRLLQEGRWRLTYVDVTIIADRPVLGPFIDRMRLGLAALLEVERDAVNLKAKSTDGLGFTGRGEGIAALAVATLESTE
jgi:2-C-methyl-D-erythritol 2,4-cyclodiphosphate synthase